MAATPETLEVHWHDDVLTHDTGEGVFGSIPWPWLVHQMPHPEGPWRIANMKSTFERGPVAPHLRWFAGRHATDAEVLRFHTQAHLAEIVANDVAGHAYSETTGMRPGSLKAIRAAAGTAVGAVEAILSGRTRKAHALVRPPGHHAAPAMVDGYCFLNNLGIACATAIERGVKRVAVIDWDVHHGNGTQAGFYERDDVLTISLHMDHRSWGPSHPESGLTGERGSGRGKGYNINVPLPLGLGDAAYLEAIQTIVRPAIDRFRPELLAIANGQDANQFDPNGRQSLTVKGFHALATEARAMAEQHCDGRLLSVQEGGYHYTHVAFCAHATLEGFLGLPLATPDHVSFLPEDIGYAKHCVAEIAERLAAG